MFQVPSEVVVRRPITLNGVMVPVGISLSKDQVLALGGSLNALLDSGFVTAKPDPFARRGRARPTPTSLPPVIRNAMVKNFPGPVVPVSVKLSAAGLAISVSLTGGTAPFDLVLKDNKGDVLDSKRATSRTSMFTPVDGGDYVVEVTDSSGGFASASIFIQSAVRPRSSKKVTEEETFDHQISDSVTVDE